MKRLFGISSGKVRALTRAIALVFTAGTGFTQPMPPARNAAAASAKCVRAGVAMATASTAGSARTAA